jgi:hypothetical protein
MSKIKVNEIEAQTGSTITIPTGQSLVVTDGIGTSSLPTIPVSKGGTGLTSLGTANQILQVNSGANALEFVAKPSGGIAQVIQTVKTSAQTINSTSNVDIMSVSITPSSASSKILVSWNINFQTLLQQLHIMQKVGVLVQQHILFMLIDQLMVQVDQKIIEQHQTYWLWR